jgi:uncharacterized protein YdiU (UPF0061 family)
MSMDSDWLRPAAYAGLGACFGHTQAGAAAARPRLAFWNTELAATSGWPGARQPDPQLLCGARPPAHGLGFATAYAGHQFGHFVPQLGDGRALLLGDLRIGGQAHELQLKGSGRTVFSRGGDGRAALGPVLREVLVAEAMHALGVPSTRALAATVTGEQVWREAGPQPGAVLARVASSHVRVGSFEFFAARRDLESLRALLDWVIRRHYPACAEAERPALALLEQVCARQARLVAQWLSVGFVHGVMNTDNMALSGETIDYGPCAFVDEYASNKVFSSIDRGGRYAYSQQPAIAQWNLARLAESLLPLVDADEQRSIELVMPCIEGFPDLFGRHWLRCFGAKLGLASPMPADTGLAQDFLALLEQHQHDFTLAFRSLARRIDGSDWPPQLVDPTAEACFAEWLARWRARLASEGTAVPAISAALHAANPALIPRNHQVEAAIGAAAAGDFQPFERLLAACTHPFSQAQEQLAYMQPPKPAERVLQTFCGT